MGQARLEKRLTNHLFGRFIYSDYDSTQSECDPMGYVTLGKHLTNSFLLDSCMVNITDS
jgi:hypothetical protein